MTSDSARILIVEDNDTLRRGIAVALRERWEDVQDVASGTDALECIADAHSDTFDVIVTDLRLPGCDGVSVLRAARERDPGTSVLVMTAYGSIETAVEAMRSGAFDFVQKPLDLDQLELRVARGVDHRRLLCEVTELRAEQAAREMSEQIIGDSHTGGSPRTHALGWQESREIEGSTFCAGGRTGPRRSWSWPIWSASTSNPTKAETLTWATMS